MALKSIPFILICYFLVAAFAVDDGGLAPDAATPPGDGGWGFVFLNRKSPEVIAVAKFAVGEYNKLQKSFTGKLRFDAVLEAKSPTIAARGTDYGLIIETVDLYSELDAYEARVLVNEEGSKKLVKFRKL